MNGPNDYDQDAAYDSFRYDEFGDLIVPDDEYDDPGYELTYADECEDSYDGY